MKIQYLRIFVRLLNKAKMRSKSQLKNLKKMMIRMDILI